jgi:hypothetical protein
MNEFLMDWLISKECMCELRNDMCYFNEEDEKELNKPSKCKM